MCFPQILLQKILCPRDAKLSLKFIHQFSSPVSLKGENSLWGSQVFHFHLSNVTIHWHPGLEIQSPIRLPFQLCRQSDAPEKTEYCASWGCSCAGGRKPYPYQQEKDHEGQVLWRLSRDMKGTVCTLRIL